MKIQFRLSSKLAKEAGVEPKKVYEAKVKTYYSNEDGLTEYIISFGKHRIYSIFEDELVKKS